MAEKLKVVSPDDPEFSKLEVASGADANAGKKQAETGDDPEDLSDLNDYDHLREK